MISEEEVGQIFSVVSVRIRNGWEAKRNAGQSLLDVRRGRASAIAEEADLEKKMLFVALAGLLGGLLSLLVYALLPSSRKIIFFTSSAMTVVVLSIYFWFQRLQIKQQEKIKRCNDILEEFAKSIKALNLSGFGNENDILDEDYIRDIAITLAIQIIRAQNDYDIECARLLIDSKEKLRTGKWLEKCEGELRTFKSLLLRDFDLPIDSTPIFKSAQAYLDKNKPKREE